MGKLITITGISGVGKTTLARKLGKAAGLPVFAEDHSERPFHTDFVADRSDLMFANQMDFLFYRAEQELEIRKSKETGITDGGLETDYFVFTHLFHQRGLLSSDGFELCRRFYQLFRSFSPPPDLIVNLHAPLDVIKQRFLLRHRKIEISQINDLATQQRLVESWLAGIDSSSVIIVDAENEDAEFSGAIQGLLPIIKQNDT